MLIVSVAVLIYDPSSSSSSPSSVSQPVFFHTRTGPYAPAVRRQLSLGWCMREYTTHLPFSPCSPPPLTWDPELEGGTCEREWSSLPCIIMRGCSGWKCVCVCVCGGGGGGGGDSNTWTLLGVTSVNLKARLKLHCLLIPRTHQ